MVFCRPFVTFYFGKTGRTGSPREKNNRYPRRPVRFRLSLLRSADSPNSPQMPEFQHIAELLNQGALLGMLSALFPPPEVPRMSRAPSIMSANSFSTGAR